MDDDDGLLVRSAEWDVFVAEESSGAVWGLLASVPVDPRTGLATFTVRGSAFHGYSASYLGSAADGPSTGHT
jgi:hypothetical protein